MGGLPDPLNWNLVLQTPENSPLKNLPAEKMKMDRLTRPATSVSTIRAPAGPPGPEYAGSTARRTHIYPPTCLFSTVGWTMPAATMSGMRLFPAGEVPDRSRCTVCVLSRVEVHVDALIRMFPRAEKFTPPSRKPALQNPPLNRWQGDVSRHCRIPDTFSHSPFLVLLLLRLTARQA